MKYQFIDPELFRSNRERLYAKLKPNSVVIVLANDILPTNADGTLPSIQNSNLYYLSGIDQEESVVILAAAQLETGNPLSGHDDYHGRP